MLEQEAFKPLRVAAERILSTSFGDRIYIKLLSEVK